MEPMVVFAAALVLYCGFLAVLDVIRDHRQGEVTAVARTARPVRRNQPVRNRRARPAERPAGGGAARWPVPAKGSA